MRAALYHSFQGDVIVADVPDPVAPDDGVVIRVEATGICRSDWHGWMGHDADIKTFPHVPGHELAGTVAGVGGSVTRWQSGDRVTVPFCLGCGRCNACARDLANICDDYAQPGFTQWGSFAELVAIPHADTNLVALPPSVDAIAAASLGCRFATSWRAVTALGRVAADDWVAVFGCGGVGLAAVMIASAHGARVIAIDIDEQKLDLARNVGATAGLLFSDEKSLLGSVLALTGGGADISIDALGSARTARAGILSLRKRGRHVQVGLMLGADADPPMPISHVISRELEIIGSHGMQASHYPDMLAMIAFRRIDPGQLVQRVVSLDEAPAALVAMGTYSQLGVTIIGF